MQNTDKQTPNQQLQKKPKLCKENTTFVMNLLQITEPLSHTTKLSEVIQQIPVRFPILQAIEPIRFPNLRLLQLKNMGIYTLESFAYIDSLQNIGRFALSINYITNIKSLVKTNLKKVHTFEIQDNFINDLQIMSRIKFQKELSTLDVNNTKKNVNHEDVTSLNKIQPQKISILRVSENKHFIGKLSTFHQMSQRFNLGGFRYGPRMTVLQ